MSAKSTDQAAHKVGRILLAIDALNRGQISSIKAAARSYYVPYSSLRNRIHCRTAQQDLRPIN